ncbi:MAG: hybrid-cluster NAD(P)-dependent oxidoreductase [SAR324 cluster bacterium]|nr:hybrid-cluster NAD(P)-dependent oxidoreductase [SAR324 cluster bacterium]
MITNTLRQRAIIDFDKGMSWMVHLFESGQQIKKLVFGSKKRTDPVEKVIKNLVHADFGKKTSEKTNRTTVIQSIEKETDDTKTYTMTVPDGWTSFEAGSFVTIGVNVQGKTINRCYSLSSSPLNREQISITVKKIPGGVVSNWMFDHLQSGDTLEVSEPVGNLVLPENIPSKLLLISAGSGITPLMSMMRFLHESGAGSDVVFIHCARSPEDIIFRKEIESIVNQNDNIRLGFVVEQGGLAEGFHQGRITDEILVKEVPDFCDRDIYMCGPEGFMENIRQILSEYRFDLNRLRSESFGGSKSTPSIKETTTDVIHFQRSGVHLLSDSSTLLETAENIGLKPKFGCRRGICSTCQCKKITGTVVNVDTGEESGSGHEWILPCVSIAKGDVVVDL